MYISFFFLLRLLLSCIDFSISQYQKPLQLCMLLPWAPRPIAFIFTILFEPSEDGRKRKGPLDLPWRISTVLVAFLFKPSSTKMTRDKLGNSVDITSRFIGRVYIFTYWRAVVAPLYKVDVRSRYIYICLIYFSLTVKQVPLLWKGR